MRWTEHEVLIGILIVVGGAILLSLWTRWTERHNHISRGRVPWGEVMHATTLSTIGLARLLGEFAHAGNPIRRLADLCRAIHVSKSRRRRRQHSKKKRPTVDSATRFWQLAGLLFDRKTRAEIYDTYIDEIREDFLVTRRHCHSRASLAWVKTCFAIRGTVTFFRCLRIALWRPVVALIPESLKQLWKLLS